MSDAALSQFVQTQSPEAFKALVDRHSNAVYAQCVRELRDPHLAEDVTQSVFMVLHRKAKSLPAQTVVPAWLFKVTRYACANARRAELRRQRHEKEAAMTRELQQRDTHDAAVSDLESILDGSLERLGRADREAIVLRYYSGMNAVEVGAQLGISHETAKKRISRAVAKLRDMLSRNGVDTTSALLLVRLDGLSVPSAPAGLAHNILSQTINPALANPLCDSITRGVIQMMKWTKIKLAFAASLVAVVLGVGGVALTGALAQNPPTPQPANPSATPPPAVAAAQVDPVGQDAADRVMIRLTIENLARAIRANDLAAIDRLVAVPATEDGQLVKAALYQNAGYYHLQTAWGAKFQQPIKFRNYIFAVVPQLDCGVEVLMEKLVENMDESAIQISGSTARVPLKLGPMVDVLERMGIVNLKGMWMTLANDGTTWRVDPDRAVHIAAALAWARGKQPKSADEEIKAMVSLWREVGQILDKTAVAIENGSITSAPDAARQVETQVGAAFMKRGIFGLNFSVTAARPVSYEVDK